MNSYLIGNAARVMIRFRSAPNGTPVDPDTISLQVKDPTGAITTYVYGVAMGLVKEAIGIYYFDVNLSIVGSWHYRWTGTGTNQAAAENMLTVTASTF